jgi:hypothetical protein
VKRALTFSLTSEASADILTIEGAADVENDRILMIASPVLKVEFDLS